MRGKQRQFKIWRYKLMQRTGEKLTVVKEWFTLVRIIGFAIGLIGIIASAFGILYKGTFARGIVEAFYANFGTEFISLAITLIFIDWLYERRETQRLKAQLIRELGGPVNSIAMRAIQELEAYGWLEDGTLKGADLWNANLEKVDFTHRGIGLEVNLERVVLSAANLKGAELSSVSLKGAMLNGADLQAANLFDTNLQNASLSEANLEGANLTNANLQEANLSQANFHNAKLFMADLSGAYLLWANLSGADLGSAKLTGAKFGETDLQDTCLDGAELQGLQIPSPLLTSKGVYAIFIEAKTLCGATMPDGSKYDGRLNLAGDIEWARSGVAPDCTKGRFRFSGCGRPGDFPIIREKDVNDPVVMADFYNISLEEYLEGQEWAERYLSI